MKGKSKTQKGITLIALIITIVVLLILAAVAISSIQNDGILHYAQNAADNWNKAAQNEANMLGDYLNYLNNMGSGGNEAVAVTPKVGQYVEYDVSYTDMYQGTAYTKTNGWRYLGTDTDGNHLLISTAIPMKLYYHCNTAGGNAKWWDTTQTNANTKATQGMLKNFDKIPFVQKASGTSMGSGEENTAIGNFAPSKRTYNEAEYDAVGDYFKVTGKSYSSSIAVRTLTLAELNRAVNSANAGVEGYTDRAETSTSSGFKDLTGDAIGLFDMEDLTGYTANYYYWLSSPYASSTSKVYYVYRSSTNVRSNGDDFNVGVRPVVVLPSSIQFTDADNNQVLEIK